MHNAHHDDTLDAESKSIGYEVRDLRPTLIYAFGAVIALLMFFSIIIVILFQRSLERKVTPPATATAPTLVVPKTPRFAQAPQLQQNPVQDKKKIIDAAQKHLERYGLSSTEAGVERAHIPIHKAIKAIADKKAPYRQAPKPAALSANTPTTVAAPAQNTAP